TPSTTSSSVATPSAAPSVSFPLTLTDDAGRTITLPARPQRVVSLAPSNTEIVCVLGACDALTGVTDFDDYPPNVKTVAHVVVQAKVDAEKVVAARPDLVLAAGNGLTSEAAIKQLTDLRLRVMTLYPKDLSGVYHDINLVGAALGVPGKAQSTVASMQARVKAVTDAVAAAAHPRTF